MASRSSQAHEPAVGIAALKGLLLRIPAGLAGQQENFWRVPDVAAGEMLAEEFPEVRCVVGVLPLLCLLPWGHRLKLDAIQQCDVRWTSFGAAVCNDGVRVIASESYVLGWECCVIALLVLSA